LVAPAGAWLASGVVQADLGPAITVERRLNFPRAFVSPGRVDGEVVHIDRFGNLVTNIDRRAWPGDSGDQLDVAVSGYRTVRLVSTYGEAGAGEIVALFGGTDRLEIAVKSGNAAEALGVGLGMTVHVSRRA
jgi:S-adenosylmethionine hydrolase